MSEELKFGMCRHDLLAAATPLYDHIGYCPLHNLPVLVVVDEFYPPHLGRRAARANVGPLVVQPYGFGDLALLMR